MRITKHRRGSATCGAPARFAAPLLALACLAAPAGSAAARPAGTAAPDTAVAARAPLTFAGLPWDASRTDVARALVKRGFTRMGESDPARFAVGGDEPDEWRGEAFGRRVRLAGELDLAKRLVALTLRFDPDTRGTALQRYVRLADMMRRRHGPCTVQVAPGRPVDEELFGRFSATRRYGPMTAASMWTDVSGAATVVQLDGEGVLWLRYESPRWEAAAREKAEAAR